MTIVVNRPSTDQTIPEGLPTGSVAIVGSSHTPLGKGTSQPHSTPVITRVLPTPNVNSPVEVASPSASAHASNSAHKRRKSRKEGDRSSSKRIRREAARPSPLARFLVVSSVPTSMSVNVRISTWDPLTGQYLRGFLGRSW